MTDLEIAKKLLSIYDNAAARRIPCFLTFEKITELMFEPACYYTGVLFQDGYTRTFDRVDASLGYINNNVVVCTAEFNRKKTDLTIAEIELLYQKVQQFKKQNDEKSS